MGSAPIWRTLAAPTAMQVVTNAARRNAARCTHCCASLAYNVSEATPNGLFLLGLLLIFILGATSFPYMANPSWEASQREQFLQNQLLQELQQFEASKACEAQPQP